MQVQERVREIVSSMTNRADIKTSVDDDGGKHIEIMMTLKESLRESICGIEILGKFSDVWDIDEEEGKIDCTDSNDDHYILKYQGTTISLWIVPESVWELVKK